MVWRCYTTALTHTWCIFVRINSVHRRTSPHTLKADVLHCVCVCLFVCVRAYACVCVCVGAAMFSVHIPAVHCSWTPEHNLSDQAASTGACADTPTATLRLRGSRYSRTVEWPWNTRLNALPLFVACTDQRATVTKPQVVLASWLNLVQFRLFLVCYNSITGCVTHRQLGI